MIITRSYDTVINWTRTALRDMKRIDRKMALLIREKVAQLHSDPESQSGNIKFIATKNLYRLRVHNYRVFYDTDGNILNIETVKHRREAYR
jgi:mRNA-degrading endonuclease RelE of RelBE toxin-antitoxin system